MRQQLNVKTSRDECPTIFDCIKIDNVLLFTDCKNDQLISCRSDGTGSVGVHGGLYKPCYIIQIDSNTIAVSSRLARTILIRNKSTGSIITTIDTSYDCWGISYYDNNLYAVIEGSEVHVMSLTGEVKRIIQLPSYIIRAITIDKDRLICTTNTSIYCCSIDGEIMWKFEHQKYKSIRCVTTDNEGNVYLTDDAMNCVVVVSEDGKHFGEILSESDSLAWPTGIYFDKTENILLVSNAEDGAAFLFDVKKKLK